MASQADVDTLRADMQEEFKKYASQVVVEELLGTHKTETWTGMGKLLTDHKNETATTVMNMQNVVIALIESKAVEIFDKAMKDKIDSKLEDMQEQITNKIKELETKEEEIKKSKAKKDNRCLTTKRDFGFLPKYSGKHEEYDDWKFKMRTFLSEEVEFKELMSVLENLKDIPTAAEIKVILSEMVSEIKKEDDEEAIVSWTNHQLYQVLCLNLEGKALSMIKNLTENKEVNGILGWCKLAQECSSMTAQRLQGLATKVYNPKRCKNYADVNGAIEEWERNISLFSRADGKRELCDDTKLFSISQIVPEELERDIAKASSVLTDYAAVKKYIAEQVAVRRDVKNTSKGPVALDLNQFTMETYEQYLASMMTDGGVEDREEHPVCEPCGGDDVQGKIDQLYSFVNVLKGKGGKGGDKGGGKGRESWKGKGRFEGNCNFCGAYGHSLSECYKKNDQVKGKGKDGGKGFV